MGSFEENLFLLLLFIGGLSLVFGTAEFLIQFAAKREHRRLIRENHVLVLPKTTP